MTKRFEKKWREFRGFVDLIREDYRIHERDWTAPGFRALAVHRFGVWVDTIGRPRLLQGMLKRFARCLYVYVRNHYTIELPLTTKVGRRLRIAHQGGIVIHSLSEIGDDCLIHQNVTLGSATAETVHHAPILGNRVEVGCGAALIGGVRIGDDTRIGPNAVVTANIPAGCTVVAASPRIVKLKKPASRPSPLASPAPCSNNEPVPQ
jgi:serine O-acetyltransferase